MGEKTGALMSSMFVFSDKKAANRWFLFLVILIFLIFRIPANERLFNIDELIAPAVLTGMIQRGDLNGNWILAVDIPEMFRVNQFNFYSYHLFARPFYNADPYQFILNLRWVNLVLQIATLVLLLSYVTRLGLAFRHRIALVVLFVVAPALVFDTHIARSESFLYLLFALQLWSTQIRVSVLLRYALFGILLGIGCASKITFILTGAILIPEIIATLRTDLRKLFGPIGILIVAAVFGFVATAPYILIDFQGFLAGVNALFNQYGTEHPPHSFAEYSLSRNISRTLWFVLLTTGALLPLALFQATRRQVIAPGLALFGFIIIAYFATKPIFFERNIGIALFALLIFVSVNIRHRAEIWLLIPSCILMLYWSFWTAFVFGNPNINEARFERKHFGMVVPRGWPVDDLDDHLGRCEGIFGAMDFKDDFSRKMIEGSKAVPIAHFESVFAILPTSTMHTYLESDLHYFYCARPSSTHRPESATIPSKD
jgi:hypothetical protein